MNDDLLKQIRAELERDSDELVDTLAEMKGREEEPLVEMLTASLADLRTALQKLDSGAYGLCEECGGRVGELRLRSLPAAKLCLHCEGIPTDDLPACADRERSSTSRIVDGEDHL